MCPSVRRNELLRPSSLLHRSPLIYFWLLSCPHAGIFSSFSHSFAAGIFIAWGIGINVCSKLQCCIELPLLPAIWSSWWFGRESSIRSLVDSLASRMHASFDLISLVLPRVFPFLLFLHILQGIAGAIGVSYWFLWTPCSSGSMK